MKDKKHRSLNVSHILKEFSKAEESTTHRKGTFKIEAPFEKALDTVLKAKPKPKK
jgi:hypothetical protein